VTVNEGMACRYKLFYFLGVERYREGHYSELLVSVGKLEGEKPL